MARLRAIRGGVPADRGQEATDLVLGERLGQALGHAGRGQVVGGVRGGEAFVQEEAVQGADGDHCPGHRRGGPPCGAQDGDVVGHRGLADVSRRKPRLRNQVS